MAMVASQLELGGAGNRSSLPLSVSVLRAEPDSSLCVCQRVERGGGQQKTNPSLSSY
jgi:hypothetical protein